MMVLSKSRCLTLGAALLLTGCSFASDALFPTLRGGEPPASSEGGVQGDLGDAGPPVLGSTYFDPPSVTPGSPTGTFVGRKVSIYREELRQLQETVRSRNADLQRLRNDTARDSVTYHELVGGIQARLQVGTTPGNPVLTDRWSQSQRSLNKINDDIVAMNQLATVVASDSAMAAYLLDSVRAAFNLQGAVEEDHRQLRILEDETNQNVVLIERLLTELSSDVSRQQQYLANEKGNLNTLAVAVQNGQLYGASLGNRLRAATPQIASAAPGVSPLIARGRPAGRPTSFGGGPAESAGYASGYANATFGGQRPLVVIRFDHPNVAYEEAMYQAVGAALERRPNATFDLVAVTPTSPGPGQTALGANSSRRNAEAVLRSLTNMGLPADRVRLSAMNSADAVTNEVRIYVR
ncbi:MAG: hypothetical protein HQL33_10510 [Alphaproteobacteria bacterium]|nr:hypothetical protein [Alphaproteobacteria bacterium]